MQALMDLTDHQIALWSLLFSLVALAVSLVALFVSLYAIRRGNKNSSASTLVTPYEGFRQAWQRFLEAKNEQAKQYEFSELLNLFELACAIHSEHSLVGVSRELAEDYIRESWELLSNSDDAKKRIRLTLTRPRTFIYIRKFLGQACCSSLLEPPTSPVPRE